MNALNSHWKIPRTRPLRSSTYDSSKRREGLKNFVKAIAVQRDRATWNRRGTPLSRAVSRRGVRESSVSLRRVRNNLLNYRMPKVTSARREAGVGGGILHEGFRRLDGGVDTNETPCGQGDDAWTVHRGQDISRSHARPCTPILTKIDQQNRGTLYAVQRPRECKIWRNYSWREREFGPESQRSVHSLIVRSVRETRMPALIL